MVVAAYNGWDITQAPIPFWFLGGTLLLTSVLGRYLIGISQQRLLAISLPLLVLCAVLLMRISPAIYGLSGRGFFDWSWVFSFGHDIVNHSPAATALPPLLLVLAYVWWRGLRLGSDPPDYSTVMRRFKFGIIAMVAVTVASIAIPGALQLHVTGVLGFLLPAEVFSGLVAAALGRMAQNQANRDSDAYLVTNDRLWLGTAMIMALVAVGFSLLINLVVNYQSVGSLLTLLGPIGPLISKAATLLVDGLAQVLRFLFNWIIGSIKPVPGHSTKITTPVPKGKAAKGNLKAIHIPSLWLKIAEILLEVAAIVVVILLFLWLVRTIITHKRPHEAVLDEERESLDASSLFRSQLHEFLAGLRPARSSTPKDPLTPGSIRYLYRGFLEAANKRGLPRQISETPDEYGARLSTLTALHGTEPQPGGERTPLEVLDESYNSTRYADRQPGEEEMSYIRKQVKTLISRLER